MSISLITSAITARSFSSYSVESALAYPLFGQLIAFSLALYLQKSTRLLPFLESVYFMPLLISMVAASVMMSYLFSLNGPVNYLVGVVGITGPNWLYQPKTAQLVICILEIWKGCTFSIYIYVAALRRIPKEYEEVCLIEGASKWAQLRRVTIPLISNSVLLCAVMSSIWTLQIFLSKTSIVLHMGILRRALAGDRFADIGIVDMHCHLGNGFEFYHGYVEIDEMIAMADKLGVEKMCIAPNAGLECDYQLGNQKMLHALTRY